ncbi:hypothetical protein HBI51_076110 [Parastagonospora nodorum]|nr:hypothetical protein HBI51_076110 [Parastagonospora nodorum]
MSSTSGIVTLSSSIEQNTRIVDRYFTENGLPSPSLDASTPPDIPLPPEIIAAKEAALEAMDELQVLLLGPMPKIIHELIHTPTSLTSLHAMAKFKMANAFPVSETTTIPELAETSGLNDEDCTRLVRHAVASRLFLEPEPGVISHSGMSNAIANVPLLREWVEETCENMWSSSSFLVSAMSAYPGSEEPQESAYSLSRKTNLSFFEDLGTDATGAKAKRFADAMSFFQASPAMHTALLVDNYDWKAYNTIVDVGGSHGAVMLELARQNPEVKCVVQDLPEVVAGAPQGVDRVEFQPYNFFTEQPVKNADVYLFRMIFHNWGDKYCIRILENLVPALKKGSRVVINDHVVPPGGVLSPYKDRTVRAFDLVMKACFNAKERSVEDWTNLLKAADERFAIRNVTQPKGSQLQIIEVQWDV